MGIIYGFWDWKQALNKRKYKQFRALIHSLKKIGKKAIIRSD